MPLNPAMVTTALELPGYKVVTNLGVVRGIVVRSRSILGSIGAGLQTLVGGDITLLTELCEKTRADAFARMMAHAEEHGANAIISARYDANDLMQGVTKSSLMALPSWWKESESATTTSSMTQDESYIQLALDQARLASPRPARSQSAQSSSTKAK